MNIYTIILPKILIQLYLLIKYLFGIKQLFSQKSYKQYPPHIYAEQNINPRSSHILQFSGTDLPHADMFHLQAHFISVIQSPQRPILGLCYPSAFYIIIKAHIFPHLTNCHWPITHLPIS